MSSSPVVGSASAAASATEGPVADGGFRSYHGQPVLKQVVWSWEVPLYFFTGGMAGASSGLAFLSELRGNDVLARRAWALSALGVAVSPALLISDLGRPERFLNMLRMFKVTSPMSVGSWILSAAGATISVSAADAWTGKLGWAGRPARPLAALFGLPLSTYTAALLANTAVPAWHEARQVLPFVFGAGAALSTGGALAALTPVEHAAPARRLALGGAVVEGVAMEFVRRRLGEPGEPYKEGLAGRVGSVARACVIGGGSLLALRGRRSRPASVVAGALLVTGALARRWSVFQAGLQSAADPKYVISPQRSGIERGERRGAAR